MTATVAGRSGPDGAGGDAEGTVDDVEVVVGIDGPPESSGPDDLTVVEGPELSIIISCHDYGAYVRAAVESALAQEGVEVEVVVVDDGSTDDSPAVLERLRDEHGSRLTVITQPNRGQGAAMNAGFAAATAPAVIFLDADDVLHPHTAAACVRALRARGVTRVQYPMRVVDAHGRADGRTVPPDPSRLAAGDVRRAVLRHPDDLAWQPTSGNAFASAVLSSILPIPEAAYRTSADHYLSNLSSLFGEVAVLDRPGADYRVHGANADHRDHLDLARVRTVIGHTVATHRELSRVANDLGHRTFPTDPLAVRSVTFVVNRLVSLRLAPDRHPLHGDRRLRLVLAGVAAARRREDLPSARRAQMVGWFVAMGIAPRAVARRLAERALLAPAPVSPSRVGGVAGGTSTSTTAGAGAGTGAGTEAASGAAPRRSDWRFLLPRSTEAGPVRRALVRGVPTATAGRRLFEIDAASIVDGDRVRSAAGLIVHLAPSPLDLRSVASSLTPTGWAWVEVDRRRRGSRALTPARLRARADEVGLEVGALYLVAPDPARARRYVPLDHTGALGWYLRTLVIPASAVQAVALAGARIAVRIGGARVLRPLVPSYGAVLAVRGTSSGSAWRGAVPAAIEAAPAAGGRRTRTVLLTSGQDDASRAVLLPFAPGSRRPAAVVKVANRAAFNTDTIAEHDRLAALGRRIPPDLAIALPPALGAARIGDLAVTAQGALGRGRTIEADVRRATCSRRRRIADLDAATDWLLAFHRATLVPADAPPRAEGSFWRRWVLDPLEAARAGLLDERAAAGAGEPGRRRDPRDELLDDLDRLASRTLAAAASVCGAGLPRVERHHDFVPCNVLVDRGAISVVDWERTEDRDPTGPALVDLLLFVTFWYSAAHRAETPADDLVLLGRLLGGDADDPYHRAAWDAVRRYADAFAIDLRVVPAALVALWLERQRAQDARAARLGRDPIDVSRPQLQVLAATWHELDAPWSASVRRPRVADR